MSKRSGAQYGAAQAFYRDVVLNHDGASCLIWPFARDSGGYATMRQGCRLVNVHRRLCEAVHGPAPSPEHEAAHSCGCGKQGCVTKGHLRWATSEQNHADNLVHGTRLRGETHPQARLTPQDVIRMREIGGRQSLAATAREFGVAKSTVHDILSGRRWNHLAEQQPSV